MPETATQKKRRLLKARKEYKIKKSLETTEDIAIRRQKHRECMKRKRTAECSEERDRRRELERKSKALSRAAEPVEKRDRRLELERKSKALSRAAEPVEKRDRRLELERKSKALSRAAKTVEKRNRRLAKDAAYHAEVVSRETSQEHADRLARLREIYAQKPADEKEFFKTINTHCNKMCDICKMQCYPKQIYKYHLVTAKSYLPPELGSKSILELCYRCNAHAKNDRKNKAPPKAYWNNLDPGEIPEVIKALKQPERQLLSRVIPFLKVIKFDGRFGQYGFKGHATLFALDIFEVTEKLPTIVNTLPRASNDASIVVVTETLENLNISRDYEISPERVYAALEWLVANNKLYEDVQVNSSARLETQDIIRVIPPAQLHNQRQTIDELHNEPQVQSSYVPIGSLARIIRASWNQGNQEVFTSGYAGVQCLTMALANIIRAVILRPISWNTNVVDSNMIAGDEVYLLVHELTALSGGGAYPIADDNNLHLQNLDVIKNKLPLYDILFSLDYNPDWLCDGSLIDRYNDGVNTRTLFHSLEYLFENHNAGILIGKRKCFGIMHYDDKYYFTDSHSCGLQGAPIN